MSNRRWLLVQFDEHVVGLLHFRGTNLAPDILQPLSLPYSLLREEYMEQRGADEQGSSLVESVEKRLAELLHQTQRHNNLHQRIAVGSDESLESYEARPRSLSVRR